MNKKAIQYFLGWLFVYAVFAVISKVYQHIDPAFMITSNGNVLHPVGFLLLGCIAFICIPLLCATNRQAKRERNKLLIVISYGLIVHHCLWILAYVISLILKLAGVT